MGAIICLANYRTSGPGPSWVRYCAWRIIVPQGQARLGCHTSLGELLCLRAVSAPLLRISFCERCVLNTFWSRTVPAPLLRISFDERCVLSTFWSRTGSATLLRISFYERCVLSTFWSGTGSAPLLRISFYERCALSTFWLLNGSAPLVKDVSSEIVVFRSKAAKTLGVEEPRLGQSWCCCEGFCVCTLGQREPVRVLHRLVPHRVRERKVCRSLLEADALYK